MSGDTSHNYYTDWGSRFNSANESGLSDSFLGGLYGNSYGSSGTGGGGTATDSNVSSDPFGSGWGQGGDTSWTPGENPSSWGLDNGPDSWNDNGNGSLDYTNPSSFDYMNSMDMNSDFSGQGLGMNATGGYPAQDNSSSGFMSQLYDILNSKGGKLGSTLLSLAFPQIGLPLAAAKLGVGIASGHPGETIGGLAGGLAQGALGLGMGTPLGLAMGLTGTSLGSLGAGLGRSFDTSPSGTGGAPGGGFSFGGGGGYGYGGGGSPAGGGAGGGVGRGAAGAESGGNMDYGAMAAGLGGMFLGNKGVQGAQTQINNLNSLYAPNSPYAQQLQQQLERADAASGRRSQYGTRAVELQARLADAASRNAPTLASLYQQRQGMDFAKYAALLGGLKSAGAFNPSTYQGLAGIFGGGQTPVDYGTGGQFNPDPYMTDWGTGVDTGFGG